jgi:hypothetical protein
MTFIIHVCLLYSIYLSNILLHILHKFKCFDKIILLKKFFNSQLCL